MRHKLRQTLLLVVVVFVIPLLPHRELLWTWPVITAFLAGVFLNLSQPTISNENLKSPDAHDRRSVLLIMIAGTLVFLVPILDYAYGSQVRPCICEPWAKAGLLMIIGGLAWRYHSIRYLGKFFTSVVTVLEDHRVIHTGPYKYLRHPSYLGSWVMALGISAIFQSLWGLAVCVFVFFPVYMFRIHVEEKALVEALGDDYVSYRQRTWRMLPFLY